MGSSRHLAIRLSLVLVALFGAVFAVPAQGVGAVPIPPDRIASDDPYVIAADIARVIAGGNLAQLTDLIIATGEQPFDAIVSAGLAGYLDQCPRPDGSPCRRTATLLTRPDMVPAVTAQAISASGVPAARITVIGGEAAVSDQVRAEIATRSGWDGQGANPVTRVAGATRYDTAAALAQYLVTVSAQPGALPLPASARTIILATGEQPADALAASALAYRGGHLLLLSPPAAAAAALDVAVDALGANCAMVVGGPAALSLEVGRALGASLTGAGSGACTPVRIAGADRHHTAAVLASRIVSGHGSPHSVLIANAQSRALPVTAAPLARVHTSLLFTRSEALPAVTRAWVAQHPTITRATVVGTMTEVSEAAGLEVALTPPPAAGTGGSSGGTGGAAGLSLSNATLAFDTAQNSQVLAATATGGTAPYTYSVSGGTLPSAVTFNASTGAFTGPAKWSLGTAVSVSAGNNHSCAVLADTTVRCWGANGAGQLGDGTSPNRLEHPVTVTTGAGTALSGVTQISTGGGHSCALINDGTVRCWGNNFYGQLGDGSAINRSLPVTVTVSAGTPLSGVTRISAGEWYTCAVLVDATARCWGHNDWGQIGDGTQTDSTVPLTVTTGAGTALSDVVDISAGSTHTCAVMADTSARCWGRNDAFQLGDGTQTNASIPMIVLTSGSLQTGPSLSGVTQISAGYGISTNQAHTCAVLVDHTAWCWGANGGGQVGDGSNSRRSHPVAVGGGSPLVGVAEISANWEFTCAILLDTTARCWGFARTHGRLGNGYDNVSATAPGIVLLSGNDQSGPSLSGATRISAGKFHACAVVTGGLRCWGQNDLSGGGLGDGTSTWRRNPVRVLASGTEAADPTPLGGSLSFAPTTLTVTVTDGNGATASATVTLTAGP